MSEATVTPILRRGKPIRRGRWAYVSHQYNGPVWRLDGTTLDLEHDPNCHACCIGGDRCNGAWVLYTDGNYTEPVDEYLSGAMDWVESHQGKRVITVSVAALGAEDSKEG
jgi:hypothetical protein